MKNTIAILIIVSFAGQKVFSQECFFDQVPYQTYQPERHTERTTLGPHCLMVDLYCDYSTVLEFSGDRDSVRTWMQRQWDSVAVIFDSAGVNIGIASYNIPESEMWADTMAFLTMISLFYRFGLEVDNTGPGHFAHFMTTQNLGGGVAWLGTYCNMRNPIYSGTGELLSYSWNYAVSTALDKELLPIDEYQWNYNVLAHEMGHNLGLHHTHSCVWGPNLNQKIDDCQGAQSCSTIQPEDSATVMSYCHLTPVGIDLRNQGFGILPSQRMRDNIASCRKFDYSSDPVVLVGLINQDVNAKQIIIDRGGTQFVTKFRSETDIEINMPVELNPGAVLYVNQNLCGL